jgi:hypothetical protein
VRGWWPATDERACVWKARGCGGAWAVRGGLVVSGGVLRCCTGNTHWGQALCDTSLDWCRAPSLTRRAVTRPSLTCVQNCQLLVVPCRPGVVSCGSLRSVVAPSHTKLARIQGGQRTVVSTHACVASRAFQTRQGQHAMAGKTPPRVSGESADMTGGEPGQVGGQASRENAASVPARRVGAQHVWWRVCSMQSPSMCSAMRHQSIKQCVVRGATHRAGVLLRSRAGVHRHPLWAPSRPLAAQSCGPPRCPACCHARMKVRAGQTSSMQKRAASAAGGTPALTRARMHACVWTAHGARQSGRRAAQQQPWCTHTPMRWLQRLTWTRQRRGSLRVPNTTRVSVVLWQVASTPRSRPRATSRSRMWPSQCSTRC